MKLKYFIPSFIAVILALVGCADENNMTLLDEVQVSTSYIAIPTDGGQNAITLTAKGDWTISKEDGGKIPEWLHISPDTVGHAGATEVTFSADEVLDGRNTTLVVTCCGKTQLLYVYQGLQDVHEASISEVMDGPEGKSYLITATVTKISNTDYGNIYVNDGTSDTDLYIFGLFDSAGRYPKDAGGWDSWGINVGDQVIIQGSKVVYSGVVEFKDATLINVDKSLLTVDDLSYFDINSEDASSIPSAGGYAKVDYTSKTNHPIEIEIPEDAQDWLSIAFGGTSASSFMLKAAANTGAARSADITITSTDGVKFYIAEVTIVQDGLAGTKDLPFSVSEAINYCNSLDANTESAADVYIKGKVSKVLYSYSGKYGTATFWISDDGTFNGSEDGKKTTDTAHDFEVYSAYWLGNQPWVEGDAQISEGDEVVICGKVMTWNGTSETSSKKAYVASYSAASASRARK